jgi:serine/threonine-protein kinase
MTPMRTTDSAPSGVRSGQLIGGKYLLTEPLGAGGMGQVWAARNLATSAEVALKLLHGFGCTPAGAERLRREAHATAQLSHPSIVRTFDLVDADGSLAIAMERLRGRTLAELLAARAPLTIEQTMNVVLPILDALDHAHHFGVVHRDLKPENIFLALEPDGEVTPKLFDFGISKMLLDANPPITGGGEIVGTPEHMSPEQLRGGPIDARSDVFCAGIVLYMCLTGKHPFVPTPGVRAVVAVLEADPARPENLPLSLWQVIERTLAKDPAGRFASAKELADALSRCVIREASCAAAPKVSDSAKTLTGVRIVPPGMRRSAIVAGVAACAAALWLGLAWTTRADTMVHADVGSAVRAEGGRRSLREGLDVLRRAGGGAPVESATVESSAARARARVPEIARDPGF